MRAIIIEPILIQGSVPHSSWDEKLLTIHRPHPTQPKKLSVSFKNIEDKIAHMTTERAPSGVCGRCDPWVSNTHRG